MSLGERRDKGEPIGAGRIHYGSQLCPDIAPQRRIGLFVNTFHIRRQRTLRSLPHHCVSLLRSHVPGIGVQHKYLQAGLRPGKGKGRIRDDSGGRSTGGKLHARIQRPSKVIGND